MFLEGVLCALLLCSLQGASRTGLTRERYFVPTVVHRRARHARVRMETDGPSLQGPSRCWGKRQAEDENHENESRKNKAMTTDVDVENVPSTHKKRLRLTFRNWWLRYFAFETWAWTSFAKTRSSETSGSWLHKVYYFESKEHCLSLKCVYEGKSVKRPINLFISSTFAFIPVTDAQSNSMPTNHLLKPFCFQVI